VRLDCIRQELFQKQDVPSVITAVEYFEKNENLYLPENCRTNALKFSNQRFEQELEIYVHSKWQMKQEEMSTL
jgi:hypothetical protein